MFSEDVPLDRRRFAQAVAAVLPFDAVAQDPPKSKPPSPAETLTALLRERYEAHLTPEQLKLIQGSIARNLASAERMKKIPLKNSDEPAFLFRADLP